jgi:type I restriction enzyme R subunit
LEGSLSAQGLLKLAEYRDELRVGPRASEFSEDEWESHKDKLLFSRLDTLLDHEPGVRSLEDPALANEVVSSLRHFDGVRYDLISFVVMPSHFHWVFRPRESWWEQVMAQMGQASSLPVPGKSLSGQAGSLPHFDCKWAGLPACPE